MLQYIHWLSNLVYVVITHYWYDTFYIQGAISVPYWSDAKKLQKIIIFKNSKFSFKVGVAAAYLGNWLVFWGQKWGTNEIKCVSICHGHLLVSGRIPNPTFIYYSTPLFKRTHKTY